MKICGITNKDNAEMVLSFSHTAPEYLGFVFYKKSPRYISPENAQKIARYIRKKYTKERVLFVGVFVNENLQKEEICTSFSFLDVFQLHGDNSIETPSFCSAVSLCIQKLGFNIQLWKAFRIQKKEEIQTISEYEMVDSVLVDAFSTVKNEYGGSGKQVSEDLLPYIRSSLASHQKLFIAGGITAENKEKILHLSGADGIDISSSVEQSPGVKSYEKVSALFAQEK